MVRGGRLRGHPAAQVTGSQGIGAPCSRLHAQAPHLPSQASECGPCKALLGGLPGQARVFPESLQGAWPTGAHPSALNGLGGLSLELTHSGMEGVGAHPTPCTPLTQGPSGLPGVGSGRDGHKPSMALPVGLCSALGWHGVQSTQGPEHPHAHRVAGLIFSHIFRQFLRLHKWRDLTPSVAPPPSFAPHCCRGQTLPQG